MAVFGATTPASAPLPRREVGKPRCARSTGRVFRKCGLRAVTMVSVAAVVQLVLVVFFAGVVGVVANPFSKPYIAYRTSPFDHGEGVLHHEIDLPGADPTRGGQSQIYSYQTQPQPNFETGTNKGGGGAGAARVKTSRNPKCPLQLSIGVSKRLHGEDSHVDAIRSPPVIAPVIPSLGPGRQVVVNTIYEHLDLFSPAFFHSTSSYVKEILVQAPEFPLLMESSSFLTSPILTHVPAGDQSHPAVLLTDYDGGIYVVGLTPGSGGGQNGGNSNKGAGRAGASRRRYFHRAQVPRLFVRREWTARRVHEELKSQGLIVEGGEDGKDKEVADEKEGEGGRGSKGGGGSRNKPDDPYHSYFEYYFSGEHSGEGDSKEILQGVSANLLGQDHEHLQAMMKRRARKHANRTRHRRPRSDSAEDEGDYDEEEYDEEDYEGDYETGPDYMDDDPEMDDLERDQVKEWKERMGRGKVDDDDYEISGLQHLEDDEVAKAVIKERLKERQAKKEEGAAPGEGKEKVEKGGFRGGHGGADNTAETMRRRLQEEDAAPDQQQQQEQAQQQQEQQQEQQQVPDQQQQQPDAAAAAVDQQAQQQAPDQQQQAAEQQAQAQREQQQQQQQQQQAADQLAQAQRDQQQQQEQQQKQAADQQAQDQAQQQQEQQQQVPDQQGQQAADQQAQGQAQQQQEQQDQQQQVPDGQEQDQQQGQAQGDEKPQNPAREEEEAIRRKQEEERERSRNSQQDVHDGGAEAQRGSEGGRGGGGEEEQERKAKKDWYDDYADRDGAYSGDGDDYAGEGRRGRGDDDYIRKEEEDNYEDNYGGDDIAMDDPDYGRDHGGGVKYDDHYDRNAYAGYDDYYGGRNSEHEEYYDTKHYFRIPPHILCTPVLAEVPKLYTNENEKEDILLVAVSYYLDEDEYEGLFSYKRYEKGDHGDESEVQRGTYVASAIMVYLLGDSPRWSGHVHLDLTTDYSAPENATLMGELPIRKDLSKMGAFALGSPTVADIDGDGNFEVLVGTSMGILYCFDARQMYKKDNWPVQMKRPVESRMLVEDVAGDTNLEIFAADVSGNVVCLNHQAKPLWSRSISTSLGFKDEDVSRLSEMTLGDVNGDGVLDLVVAVRIRDRSFLFAFNAATGRDLEHFPIELERQMPGSHDHTAGTNQLKLTQPLLVDLHADQSFLTDYLRRNGTAWTPKKPQTTTGPFPHGGAAPGLHILYPQGETLYIIEAGSGCAQTISIGDKVSAMIQVDDVHGTNRLDLVVSTENGDIITLESASPYHPLNTWNHGELRGRMNAMAHGYSASQGIFVHEMSRQYTDIFGVYVPITFEIFDNRPNIQNEADKRKYNVEVRAGTSSKRALFRAEYTEPGVYTERVYVRFGPGYYSLSVVMTTTHGLMYQDTFHLGYNVHFMSGFAVLLWLPLLIASATIFFCGVKRTTWDEQDDLDDDPDSHSGSPRGILGRDLPS